MRGRKNQRGVIAIGEYVILVGVVLGAIILMQTYMKGHIAGAIKSQTDAFVTAAAPGATTMNSTHSSESTSTSTARMENATKGGLATASSGKSKQELPQ